MRVLVRCRSSIGPGLLCASVVAAGCGDGADIRVTVQYADSGGVTVVTIHGTLAALPEWTVSLPPSFEISGHAEPFLGSIGSVALLSDGRVVVEDNLTDEVRLFDATDASGRMLGGKGDGPGEFQNVRAVSVAPGDTIHVFDSRHNRVSTFTPEGVFVRSLRLEREVAGAGSLLYNAWVGSADEVLLYSVGPSQLDGTAMTPLRDQRTAEILAVDASGAVRARGAFQGGYSIAGPSIDAGSPFANRPLVAIGGGRVHWSSGVHYELTFLSPDLVKDQIVRWPEWGLVPTDSVVGVVRDTVEAGLSQLREARPQMAEALMNAMFGPDILPEALPALGDLLVDDGGRIWVSRFHPTTDRWNQSAAWHVLDPAGSPLARVVLPDRSRLVAVRGRRVALVQRDELEVEHLRVFTVVGDR